MQSQRFHFSSSSSSSSSFACSIVPDLGVRATDPLRVRERRQCCFDDNPAPPLSIVFPAFVFWQSRNFCWLAIFLFHNDLGFGLTLHVQNTQTTGDTWVSCGLWLRHQILGFQIPIPDLSSFWAKLLTQLQYVRLLSTRKKSVKFFLK